MRGFEHDHASGLWPLEGRRAPALRRRAFRPRLEGLEDRTVPSTLTVLNTLDKGAGSLRDTITKAKNGDTIVFAPSLDGQTITLTSDQITINNSLDIEGPGAGVLAISGNNKNRVFDISEGNTITIAGLTITHGRGGGGSNGSDSAGGGILNVGSSLTLANDCLSFNTAFNMTGAAGGAVANRDHGSNLTVTGCTFVGNQAISSGTAEGAAIANTLNGAMLTVINSTFINNQAVGINGGIAGGGAIENDGDVGGASASIGGSSFTNNMAIGGDGGVLSKNQFLSTTTGHSIFVGIAYGGAMLSSGPSTSLTVTDSTFTGNEAVGGNGASGGSGASVYNLDTAVGGAISDFNQSNLIIDTCNFSGNQAIAGSNATGAISGHGHISIGYGGAVANSALATVSNSAFAGNVARGGRASTSLNEDMDVGLAVGGAIDNAPFFDGSGGKLSVSTCMFTNNQAIGGAGNIGGPFTGDGVGGGVANGGDLTNSSGATASVQGSTFTSNQALGAAGSPGSNGADGLGGAVANILGSSLTASSCTLSSNQALGGAGHPGASGGNGFGGGAYNDGQSSLTILVSTISGNQAEGGSAGTGGSAGLGEGGGLYLADGGVACLDAFTQANTTSNHATTDHDDIFGSFTTC
jgi:hypothetical protein